MLFKDTLHYLPLSILAYLLRVVYSKTTIIAPFTKIACFSLISL